MDKDWRCQRYGPLGIMETVVKILAIGVGVASLSIYNHNPKIYPSKLIGQIVFQGIIGFMYLLLIVQRILDKELFALGFIIIQNVGHWILFLVMFLSVDAGAFIFTYVFLMILGEFIKVCFLFLAENIEVKFFTKPILFGISGAFILFYIIILILQVVIWLLDYPTNNA